MSIGCPIKEVPISILNHFEIDGIHAVIVRKVTKFGNSGKVDCPKKYLGRKDKTTRKGCTTLAFIKQIYDKKSDNNYDWTNEKLGGPSKNNVGNAWLADGTLWHSISRNTSKLKFIYQYLTYT